MMNNARGQKTKKHVAGANETSSSAEIRVTDRRRVSPDGKSDAGNTAAEAPSLKPSYVEELERRARAAEQKMLEVQARFDNLRADLQRETDEIRQRLNRAADERAELEKGRFVAALLPIIDDLWRALEAARNGGSSESLWQGVETTAKSFESTLRAMGVEPVESAGAPFNPELHEAVDTIEVEPEKDGRVVAEYSRGYKIGDRLVRPARVQVGRRPGPRH